VNVSLAAPAAVVFARLGSRVAALAPVDYRCINRSRPVGNAVSFNWTAPEVAVRVIHFAVLVMELEIESTGDCSRAWVDAEACWRRPEERMYETKRRGCNCF
jgi:hypothetical protein